MGVTKTILIVDDNSDDQHLICMLFRRSQISFAPVFVSSLNEARQKLCNEKFDVVTLDGNLRGDMGYYLIPDIRNSASKKATIIMFSANDDHIKTGIDLGADWGFNKNSLIIPMRFNECFDGLVPAKVKALGLFPMKICGVSADFFLTMQLILL